MDVESMSNRIVFITIYPGGVSWSGGKHAPYKKHWPGGTVVSASCQLMIHLGRFLNHPVKVDIIPLSGIGYYLYVTLTPSLKIRLRLIH